MDTKLIAALACGAALALGACSGGGTPATPATPSPADPADPAAPDDRTAAEKAFDTALDNAEKALADARALVTAAEARAAAAGTDAARTAAQADIDEARTALGRAVAAAKALDAPSGDYDRIGAAAIQVDKAEAAEDEDETKLRAAEGSTGWAGSSALVIGKELLRPATALSAVRRLRRNADGTDAATLLKDADIQPVMYDAGRNQIVMADGLGSTGDRLPMRGIPVVASRRSGGTSGPRLLLFAGAPDLPRLFLDPVGGGNNGAEPKLVAGLRITSSGLVVDMGGKGAAGIDLRLPSTWPFLRLNQQDGSNGGYDLTLPFGRPSASPEGNAEHYWTAALMPSPEHVEAQSALFKDGERLVPLGAYALRLSNHAGLDRNLEDPDDPAASAEDDVNHYLSYAAYGHMEFRYSAGGYTVPAQRTFPFHVGYDAFKDEEGMKTTDIADADKIAKGTFKGRTLAAQFGIENIEDERLTPQQLNTVGPWPKYTGSHYLRLRGDIELTATISGTAADNKISGKIKDLESWDAKGFWEDYARITGDLDLQETAITASGSFAGVVDTSSLAAFAEGGYKGNFYGPLAGLEAAGIWYLQDGVASDSAAAQNLSIVGSFGAALVREDGVWGVARRGGG